MPVSFLKADSAQDVGILVVIDRFESAEERIARYLEHAARALATATHERSVEMQRGHVDIAMSWMQLAERTHGTVTDAHKFATTCPQKITTKA